MTIQQSRGLVVSLSVTDATYPSSLAHRWPMDEGSGSVAADVEGGEDITLNGTYTWVNSSGGYEGGAAIDWGGGYGTLGVLDSTIGPDVAYSIAMTINPDDKSNRYFLWEQQDGNDDRDVLSIQPDGDLWHSQYATWTSEYIAAGDWGSGKQRICVTHDGSGGRTIYVDGGTVTQSSENTDPRSSINNGNHNFARSVAGSYNYNGVMDNVAIYSTELSAGGVQDDYNSQPWS